MAAPPAPPPPPPTDDLDDQQAVIGVNADFKVTPWDVEGIVDYDKLSRDFGSSLIDDALRARLERVTGKALHPFLRRGVFYSHRELTKVLDLYEKGEKFYLYTGRGPSSDAMHVGHLTPFLFTKYLQDAFNVPLVIQITDDEKFLFKDFTQEQMEKLARENIRDIIAIGFDLNKTFIFQNYNYMGHMYRLVSRIQKTLTASQVRGCFGFKGEDNVGKWMFPAVQAAPSFPDCFPHIFPPKSKAMCLIPCAIDQDPYFRLTRDIAPKLKYQKPALIHSKFFPALGGAGTKMSGSATSGSILLTDTPKQVKKKIDGSFSGGGATKSEQFLLGANTDVDIPIQWLSFFLDDDEKLAKLKREYSRGRLLTGDVKKELTQVITDIITTHQKARAEVSEALIDKFMEVRTMGPLAEAKAAPAKASS